MLGSSCDQIFNRFLLPVFLLLFQAYTSVRGASPELKENKDLAVLMNNVSFHSKLVDAPERLLNEISDLSIFW